MSKAFDRVNHDLLLHKLEKMGIRGLLLDWISSYLRDRTLGVRVDGAFSKPVLVTSGVPQGSVLGPLLFIAYANDLPQILRCQMTLFADDIKLWIRVKNREDCFLLQRDLDQLQQWSLDNKLLFILRKCKMLSFGKPFYSNYFLGAHQLD